MKNQASFSSKDKNKKLKCPLLQFLFGTLRVKSSGVLNQFHPGLLFSYLYIVYFIICITGHYKSILRACCQETIQGTQDLL